MTKEQYLKVFKEILKDEEYCVFLTPEWNHLHGHPDNLHALFVALMLHNKELPEILEKALNDFKNKESILRKELKKAT